MKCNKCGTEMVKVFSFEEENLQKMMCPNCGASTKGQPIEYDSETGDVVLRKPKRQRPKKRGKVNE